MLTETPTPCSTRKSSDSGVNRVPLVVSETTSRLAGLRGSGFALEHGRLQRGEVQQRLAAEEHERARGRSPRSDSTR